MSLSNVPIEALQSVRKLIPSTSSSSSSEPWLRALLPRVRSFFFLARARFLASRMYLNTSALVLICYTTYCRGNIFEEVHDFCCRLTWPDPPPPLLSTAPSLISLNLSSVCLNCRYSPPIQASRRGEWSQIRQQKINVGPFQNTHLRFSC
jgi:hypothetical protein